MSTVFTVTGTFNVHTCPSCGVKYALESDFDVRKSNENGSWYCPNGHSVTHTESALQRAEKAAKRAQEFLDIERRQNERLHEAKDRAERRAAAARGQVTKIKNRVKNGACPCCNRHFSNLERHMTTQHPDFVEPKA